MFGGSSSTFGASSFGQPSQQPGQSGGLFGASTNKPSLFGSSTTSQASTGSFFGQQSKPSLFSGTGTTSQQTSAFGSQSVGSSMFGTQSTQQPSLFQSASPFGSTSTVSGTTIKFEPFKSMDTMVRNGNTQQINTKHMCITAMKQYENKSLEELRVEDYIANRKGGQAQGSSLFGSTTSGMASQGLFGASSQPKPSGIFSGQTSTAGSLFSTTTSKPATGLFGTQPASTGSLFGTTPASTAQTSGLFGTSTAALSKPTQPVFGPSSQAGQTSAAGSLFSTTTTKPTGLFGTQPTGTTGGIFGTTQAPAQSGGLFGTGGLAKPAQPSIFGGASAPTTGGPTTSGFLFGQAQKPATGGGLFGNAQQAGTTSLFGQQQQQQSSLFGASALQKPAQPSLFGNTATPQSGFTNATAGLTNAGSPPIVLGSNVNIAGIQQAIIDAQLSALPYGDSPLLRSPQSPKDDRQKPSSPTPSGLQKQLRFLAGSVDTALPMSTSTVTPSPVSLQSARLPVAGADLNTSGSFLYRPLVSLPSVGFGPTLGLTSPSSKYYLDSPGSLSKTRSFLTTQENGDENTLASSILGRPATVRKAKALDISVIHKSSPARVESVSPGTVLDHTTSDIGTPLQQRIMNDSSHVVPPLSIDASSPSTEKEASTTERPLLQNLTDRSQERVNPEPELRVKLSRAEYYCQPTKEALQDCFSNGLCHIEAGLTVGRLGYGSVFWRGPFEVRNLNLDEIVHFRNKEIVVYPDESTKPEIGTELNRLAEVSLERVWPVGKDKQIIKDPDELVRLGFREKLERLCLKMGAEFKDYQPSTGTWQFTVPHFSKYGFDEEDDDRNVVLPTSQELDLLLEQRRTQAMIQRAKQPFREIQIVEDMDQSDDRKLQSIEPPLDRRTVLKKPKNEETETYDYGELLTRVKKLKYDPNTFESAEQSVDEHRQKRDLESILVLRNPINAFKGLSEEMVQNSVLAVVCPHLCRAPFSLRKSYRVGFGQNFTYVSQNDGQYKTSLVMSRISIVPCVNEYFEKYLESKGRIEEFPEFQKSDLLRWNPPSALLRLIDLFIVDVKKKYPKHTFSDKDIFSLCDSLLLSSTPDRGKIQRVRLGLWLKDQLAKFPSTIRPTDSPFYQIYVSLTNGSTRKALTFARNAHLYNLALMISMFSVPAPSHIHDLMSEQLQSMQEEVKRVKSDIYYMKILQLLAGPSHNLIANNDHCLTGLKWMQVLGIIIWYWSKPGTDLLHCVDLYQDLLKNKIVNELHLYS